MKRMPSTRDMHEAVGGVERLMAGSQGEVVQDLAASERAARFNWLLGLSAVAVAVLLAGLLASRLSTSLVKPLQQLVRAAHSLAAGHLGHRVAIDSTSELNEVGGSFNAMAEALERQRDELERRAFSDSLTGLANRALFEDRTRHAIDRLAGGTERVAVVVLDLDGFKLVNDALGHSCGDDLLRHAAERMSGMLRPSDTLARLRSDEFAVLLENVRGLDDALGAAERMRDAFRDPFILKGSEVLVTTSVGIALSDRGHPRRGRAAAPGRHGHAPRQAARARRLRVLRPGDGRPGGRKARDGQRPAAGGRSR